MAMVEASEEGLRFLSALLVRCLKVKMRWVVESSIDIHYTRHSAKAVQRIQDSTNSKMEPNVLDAKLCFTVNITLQSG